jgi:hypothetical protein
MVASSLSFVMIFHHKVDEVKTKLFFDETPKPYSVGAIDKKVIHRLHGALA